MSTWSEQVEQDLSEVVVEVPSDLEPLVGAFLRHLVRKLAEDLLTLLKLNVCFL